MPSQNQRGALYLSAAQKKEIGRILLAGWLSDIRIEFPQGSELNEPDARYIQVYVQQQVQQLVDKNLRNYPGDAKDVASVLAYVREQVAKGTGKA